MESHSPIYPDWRKRLLKDCEKNLRKKKLLQHGEICGAKAFLLALIKIPEKVPAVKVQILAVMGKFYRFFDFLRCKIRKNRKHKADDCGYHRS